jgi:Phage late-transcription coactivator
MPTKDEMLKFSMSIEDFVARTDYTYLEAIAEHCKQTGLELEVAATLITPNLKAKIQEQAERNNLLKTKNSRLPI